MRCFYLDASATSKRYAPEVGTPLVNHLFTNVPPDRLYVLNVNVAEVMSVLVRKRNAGQISAAAYAQALIDFGAEVVYSAVPHKRTADDALVRAALSLIQVHSINATDALVLRSALNEAVALRAAGNDLVLVASDQRLLNAAQAEGLVTFNPQTQTQADLDALLQP